MLLSLVLSHFSSSLASMLTQPLKSAIVSLGSFPFVILRSCQLFRANAFIVRCSEIYRWQRRTDCLVLREDTNSNADLASEVGSVIYHQKGSKVASSTSTLSRLYLER